MFLTNLVANKNISKENFAENFPFTTSETMGDYYL